MKHNTNTAAAAKIATAANTNKVNTETKKAAKVATALDAATIAAAAKDAAAGCHTCKEIAAKFAALVAEYGKDNAILIQKAAKMIVTDAKTATTAAALDANNFLKDGAKVAAAAWRALLNEDRSGAQFARILFDSCGRNLGDMIVKYASFVGIDENGAKVAAVGIATKDKNGNTITTYKKRNTESVSGYLAALKLAVRNGKRAALGAKVAEYQKEVSF